MYKIGDYIIYGGEGVCQVEDIGHPDIGGLDRTRSYYTLKPLYRDGMTYTPVDTKVFMRPVISREEAGQLIEGISDVKPRKYQPTAQEPKSLRMLNEHYDSFLQSHQCEDLICLLHTVHIKGLQAAQNNKKLGQIDEKYKKRAEERLHGELAVALGIPRDEVEDYIKSRVTDRNTLMV